ncbi:helix-turn-helix transcriptional regulator [Actinokineospora bangkokensis]|uniref:LuxR family transcriptional regulator n=1 Tax=Actinokineospora bangkokensis TaxID=1193682 RepID=A0A1Q9LK52_9PSEU|nr:LuxR family transcriptional regulator [Actinokineospora bangkokensis]OLR92412.1 LuxR family transcriptional regulator [Actinokineospora bangkokensis]
MRTRSPAIVGREPELDEIAAALAGAQRARGGAVFLVGEPGVGKTRLAAEAVGRALESGMVVLRGRGSTTGPAVPFRALSEALLSLARTAERGLVDQLGPYRSALGRLIPEWADGDADAGDGSLVVLAEATLRLAGLAGRGRGCLVVLDDLQDADVETLAVVEYLAGNLFGQPVALLATVRAEPGAALDLAHATARGGDGVVLGLRSLDRGQVTRIIAACLGTGTEQVSPAVADRLFADSAGNPLMVEELLHSMVAAGELVRGGDEWRFTGQFRGGVPPTLVHVITRRAERLGPRGVHLLSIAAVLGRRFPLSVVQRVSELDDRSMFSHLQSAVDAQLLHPDERGEDWYAFQHPLTAEALLTRLSPADRASLSARAADALVALHPDLPGELCSLVASLRVAAGDRWAAAGLYAEAARRALADGAPGSSIVLLEQAVSVLDDDAAEDRAHAEEHRELHELLLFALAEAGQFDRAVHVASTLRPLGGTRDTARQVKVHVRLAWAAQVAGRWGEGVAQVAAARALLPPDPPAEDTVAIDAVDAYLTMSGPQPDRVRRSEELGRRAVTGAERIDDPSTACQALYAVGFVVRERDMVESDACFRRMLDIAAEHRLTSWRTYALIGLGGNAWLADGDPGPLETARAEALRTGGISLAHNAEAVLGLHTALTGDFDTAARRLAACGAESSRIKLVAVTRYVHMAGAVLAAHRGDRARMRARLDEFYRTGGGESPEAPLARGLAKVFCALLEEDLTGARAELDEIAADQAKQPSTFYLAGPHGLKVLLDALHGAADLSDVHRVAASPAGRMRWNRQFLHLAEAVLHGTQGSPADADRALAAHADAAARFPTARLLGLRLIAEPAIDTSWGDPATWLREAEAHFHRLDIAPVASACRALMRRAGAPVQQRRTGTERVPGNLRTLGVTVREYEVFELLAHRLPNKALAARLHISPRTVEKHVASLLMKTQIRDRGTLVEYAAQSMSQV